ncbi:conserved hypothetical protein [Gammaproteobacteria bacterium]
MPSMRSLVLVGAILVTPVQAQQPLPIIDQLTSPFTDSEIGGLGCLTASVATGGFLAYLMGGIGQLTSGFQGPLPAPRVLEGAAAASFIFSSVCYIGAALAPVAVMTYTSIVDRIPENFSVFGSFSDSSPPEGVSPEKPLEKSSP